MNMTRFGKLLIQLKLTRPLDVSARMDIDLCGGTFPSTFSQKIIAEHRIQWLDHPPYLLSYRSKTSVRFRLYRQFSSGSMRYLF
jgi:hypothetical protein